MAETWVLNPNYSNKSYDFTGLSFNSNGETFSSIKVVGGFSNDELYYDNKDIAYIQDDDYVNWKAGEAYKTLIFQTAPTGDLLTWLQANGTKVVSLRESVEQHITDAYTAIGNKSGTIPTQKNLANLAGAIGTISTGVDTSDGNIEPTTVLKGYKGYAKGVAVDGAIETYDGTVGDVGFNITVTGFYANSGGTGNNNIFIAFDRVPTTTDYDYSFVTQSDNWTPIVKDKTGNVVTAPLTISGVKTINVIETTTGSNVWFNVSSGTQHLIDLTQDDRSGSYTFTQNITDMEWTGSFNE